jgi:hypothetical protein
MAKAPDAASPFTGSHRPLRIVALLPTKEEQTLFGFFEEISLSSKKRDCGATTPILEPNSPPKNILEDYYD